MTVSARAYLTSGIAALGVGVLALTPIQPLPDHMAAAESSRVVEGLAVKLAAEIDPFTPWIDTFKAATANIETLGKFYAQKPLPLLDTIGANFVTYINELTNGNADLIPEQIWGNVQTFFQAPWSPGDQADLEAPPAVPEPVGVATGEYASGTYVMQGAYPKSLIQGIVGFYLVPQSTQDECKVDGNCAFVQAAPALNFLSAPYSGQLLALAGVALSPVVQLVKSFTAVGEFFKNGDVTAAINELINIPANTTNAFLNGAGTWDLTAIAKKIAPDFPIEKLALNLGGLLNAVPFNGSVKEPEVYPITEYSGGVGIDSLDVAAKLGGITLGGTGLTNGWAGSVIGLGQYLGEQMLVTPPVPPPTVAAAAVAAPAPAAGTPAEPAAPAVPATPASNDTPAVPATPAEPATPAVPAVPDVDDIPAAVDTPADDAPAQGHRGRGGNDTSDNGGNSSGRGHRGDA